MVAPQAAGRLGPRTLLSEPALDILKVAPAVAVACLDDSAVTLNVRPWAKCEDYWAVYSAAQVAVLEAFAKNGVDVPFPQVEVTMKK